MGRDGACRVPSLQAICANFLATSPSSTLLDINYIKARGQHGAWEHTVWDLAVANSSKGLDAIGTRVLLNLLLSNPFLAAQLSGGNGNPINMSQCAYPIVMKTFADTQIVAPPENIKLDFTGSLTLSDSSLLALLTSDKLLSLRISSLCFSGCLGISDSSVSFTQNLHETLQELNLNQCTSISDECLAVILQKCSNLTFLNIADTFASNKSVRLALERCSNLQYLNLGELLITDSIIPSGPRPRLQTLLIKGYFHRLDTGLSDKFLEQIPTSFPMLQRLEIHCRRFTQSTICKTIQALPHIEVCGFSTPFTEAELHTLCPGSTTIVLDGNWDRDSNSVDLQSLLGERLPHLQHVKLSYKSVSNIECLAQCTKLTTLKLLHVQGTGKSPLPLLQSIAQSGSCLEKLSVGTYLMACSDIQSLLHSLPSLRSIHLDGISCARDQPPITFRHPRLETITLLLRKANKQADSVPRIQFICPRLNSLTMQFMVPVSRTKLETIISLLPASISSLTLSDADNLPGITVSLKHLPLLRSFNAPFSVKCCDYSGMHVPGTVNFGFDDTSLFPVSTVSNLQSLHIFNGSVTESEIQYFGQLPFLRVLNMTNNHALTRFVFAHPAVLEITLLYYTELKTFKLDCPQLLSLNIDGCPKIASKVAACAHLYNVPNLRFLNCIMTSSCGYHGEEVGYDIPAKTFVLTSVPPCLTTLHCYNTIRLLPELRLTDTHYKIESLRLYGCYMLESITISLPHLYHFDVENCPRVRNITITHAGEMALLRISNADPDHFSLTLGAGVECVRRLFLAHPFAFSTQFLDQLAASARVSHSIESFELPQPPCGVDYTTWQTSVSKLCPKATISLF
ncbi:hypothetical protein Pelo_735 [Pelomyxa schiedti]|nr:hypothetical protein Pelo_735 [Pelomyxa schiedti]